MMDSRKEYWFKAMEAIKEDENETREVYEEKMYNLARYLYNQLNLQSLYRYRSDANFNRDRKIFKKDQVWFAPLNKQNDPFECSINADTIGKQNREEINPWTFLTLGYLIQDGADYFKQEWERECREYPVACLSESKDIVSMWAHYANNHQGYCVEYPVLDIFNQFHYGMLPVMYQQEMPRLSDILQIQSLSREAGSVYLVSQSISTKAKCWESEREWRVIRAKEAEGPSDFPKPTAVYLGCRAEKAFIEEMKEICKEKNIPVYQIQKSKTEYTFEPILLQK